MADAKEQFRRKILEERTESVEVKGAARSAKPKGQSVGTVGHCIRCGDGLPLNPDRPLCDRCYDTWVIFGDETYPEKYVINADGQRTFPMTARFVVAAIAAEIGWCRPTGRNPSNPLADVPTGFCRHSLASAPRRL